MNLVDVHVLDALRRIHSIPLYRVRAGIQFLMSRIGSRHPLAEEGLKTNDIDLFYEAPELKQIINISKWQLAFSEIIEPTLRGLSTMLKD